MKKIALVRGKFLTEYDMNLFENMSKDFEITAFSSKTVNVRLTIPLVKLWSPMDLPTFPFKMQILNRLFVDAHYLFGLEENLKGFDIVHTSETYFHFTQQVLNAKKRGYVKKVICTVFENIPFNNEGIWGRKSFKKRAIKEVDFFIAGTQGAKEALIKEGADENNIKVVMMGIDPSEFTLKSNFGKINNSKSIKILFAGRIEEYKGVFDVLEAFKLLKKDNGLKAYDLSLTIIGNGSKKEELKKRLKDPILSNSISLRDHVAYSKLADVYKSADIFVGPSKQDKYWKEQFGMVFLEAMSTGLPIISTNFGSIPEIVGSAGILVKEGNIQEIYESLKKLILNPDLRLDYSNKSKKRIDEVFSIKTLAKQMEEVYRSVLGA